MVYTWSKGKILDILYIVGPRYFLREGVSALTLHPTPVPPPPPPPPEKKIIPVSKIVLTSKTNITKAK